MSGMAFKFAENWTDEIAEASEEFQNGVVQVIDPSLIESSYDIETGEWTVTGDGVLFEGPVRVMPIRWGVNLEGETTANSSVVTAVTVQVPKNAIGRVARGWTVKVVECADNPTLVDYVFRVTSGLQGSNAASRTFECAVDGDVLPAEVDGG